MDWGTDEVSGRIFHCPDHNCDTAFCVDLPGADASAGNSLWLWECSGLEGQSWSLLTGPQPPPPQPSPPPPGPIDQVGLFQYRADRSMCIGFDQDMPIVSSCTGDVQLTFDPETWTIQHEGQCMGISNGAAQSGGSLQLTECDGVTNWGYDEDTGRIFHCMDDTCETAFCVDIPGGDASEGSALWVWDCVTAQLDKAGHSRAFHHRWLSFDIFAVLRQEMTRFASIAVLRLEVMRIASISGRVKDGSGVTS